MTALFDQVPPERFEEPGVTADGWSAKDVMFHVAAWLEEASEALERERTGVPDPEPGDMDAKNAAFLATSRALGADAVRSRFALSRDRMLDRWAALQTVTPNAWEWLDESGPRHYAAHMDELRAWIARVRP